MQKCALLGLSLFLLSLSPVARADAVVSPGSAFVGVGSFFSVPVSISAVTDLYDFQFDLAFDPSVLQLQSVSEGAFLPSAGTTAFFSGLIDNTAGTVSFVADSLIGSIPGASGGGTLVNLDFQAVSLGSSALTLSNVILQDHLGNDIPFTTLAGQAVVVPDSFVPEPGLLWPLGVLLCALLLRTRTLRRAGSR